MSPRFPSLRSDPRPGAPERVPGCWRIGRQSCPEYAVPVKRTALRALKPTATHVVGPVSVGEGAREHHRERPPSLPLAARESLHHNGLGGLGNKADKAFDGG